MKIVKTTGISYYITGETERYLPLAGHEPPTISLTPESDEEEQELMSFVRRYVTTMSFDEMKELGDES